VEAEVVLSTAAACGVRNAYPVPANLGVDRWLGVIAAHARRRQLTCVVGVGTAMTIDGVDASGQHLGGVIVPGPDLMVGSLLRNTSEIARRAEQGARTDSLFADNTLGAIHQGAAHALAALVERSMHTMRRNAGTEPVLVLTGGAVPIIERLLDIPFESVSDLVLRGLARYASSRE
jgi:type III pantothenate kinase